MTKDDKKSGRDIVVPLTRPKQQSNKGTLEVPSKSHPPEIISEQLPVSVEEASHPGRKPFPFNLPKLFELVLAQNDQAYAVFHDRKNNYVLEIGSREMDLRIRMVAEEDGKMLRRSDIAEINEYLQAWTEMHSERVDVFYRVCPIEGGIELDVGDPEHSRIRISDGKLEVI